MNKSFKYTVDSFDDIKVVRYLVPGFTNLSLKQKLYIYYLNEASKCGRDILWMQKNKNNLMLRKVLENIINTYSGNRDTNSFKKFLVYVKKVFFSNGFTHHYNNNKFYPDIDKKYFIELLDNSDVDKFPIKNNDYTNFKNSIINIIFEVPFNNGDLLYDSLTNFYENVSSDEAIDYYNNLKNKSSNQNISFGLNSKLLKENDKLVEKVYSVDGIYSNAIKKIVDNLYEALKYCENEAQKEYTKILINYYKSGDLKLWDDYAISWVDSTDGDIDYINGFVETYLDPIGIKGAYEGIVELIDKEESRITDIIADNALWFEQNSPTDEKYKKASIKGVSAKVVNVTMLSGDSYPSAPIGINLPNSTWIREKYGSKSVSISNLVKAVDNASLEDEKSSFEEFSYDKTDLDKKKRLNIIGNDIHTHLHECLGHASGVMKKGITGNSLKEYYSSIEEARADLFALYFIKDQKLVDLGILTDLDVADIYYETYIRNGLQTQLTRLKLGQNVVEAHMQARMLISKMAYEMGFEDNVIEKKIKDNKTYFIVNDPFKLRKIFGKLLKEVQEIVSEGNYNKAKELIERYAVKVDYDLHKETLKRYEKLNLKPYIGYINPNYILVKNNDKIIDVELSYENDFLSQQLNYGRDYSFLD